MRDLSEKLYNNYNEVCLPRLNQIDEMKSLSKEIYKKKGDNTNESLVDNIHNQYHADILRETIKGIFTIVATYFLIGNNENTKNLGSFLFQTGQGVSETAYNIDSSVYYKSVQQMYNYVGQTCQAGIQEDTNTERYIDQMNQALINLLHNANASEKTKKTGN